MEITRRRDKKLLHLSLTGYIDRVLDKYSMNDAKVREVPMAHLSSLSKMQCPKDERELAQMKDIPYANAVGCLMYSMTSCRPDIAVAMGQLSKYMSNAGKEHWEAMKWLFRGSSTLGLVFGRVAICYVERHITLGRLCGCRLRRIPGRVRLCL